MLYIDNGNAYLKSDDGNIIECIGSEIQYNTTETTSETIYQWQKFNLETGCYENDTTNTTQILGQTPVNGQVTIEKLQDVQNAKIQEINALYNQALSAGFTSSASGSSVNYTYNTDAQQSFDELFLLRANNAITYPTTVYSSTLQAISLTESQLTELMTDITSFKMNLKQKQYAYIAQVQACTTVDTVNAIEVSF